MSEFLTWTLVIRRDGNSSALNIIFHKPVRLGDGYAAEVQLSSPFHEEKIRVRGQDELQAFGCLFAPTRGAIERLMSQQGVEVFHSAPGDLESGSFWGFKLTVPKRRSPK